MKSKKTTQPDSGEPKGKRTRRKRPIRLCVLHPVAAEGGDNDGLLSFVTEQEYATTAEAIKDAQDLDSYTSAGPRHYLVIRITAEFELEVETVKTAKVKML